MNNTFPKTDIAKLLDLTEPLRPLALLAALRFVAVEDLVRFGLVARIEELVDSAYVFALSLQRRLTDKTAVPVLALRRSGAQILAKELGVEPATVPSSTLSSCRRSVMFLDHALAESRFALLLAVGLQEHDDRALLSYERDRDRLADVVHHLRAAQGLGRQPLVADALAIVKTSRGVEGLLIEIDRGTERPNYLGKKYAGYLKWWRDGGHRRRFDLGQLRVLTIAPDRRRAEALVCECRERTGGRAGGLFWFAAEEDLVVQGIQAPVWSNLRAEGLSLFS